MKKINGVKESERITRPARRYVGINTAEERNVQKDVPNFQGFCPLGHPNRAKESKQSF